MKSNIVEKLLRNFVTCFLEFRLGIRYEILAR